MDTYRNFEELARNEQEGRDYVILYREMGSAVAIMAPHGGGIEPGTLDIADALAGSDFSFYALNSIKGSGGGRLHLTSNGFDEPIGLEVAGRAAVVVTIHGNRNEGELVFIGGRNNALKKNICQALNMAGFRAEISDLPGLRGISRNNICNRGKNGEGVQLEISRGLRKKMFENFCRQSIRKKNHIFQLFVDTIKKVLLSVSI